MNPTSPEPAATAPTPAPAGRLGDLPPLPPNPPVSIVMPVLNESRHLAEAVRRALSQDYPGELELVIALGPSTDDTDEIAARLAAEDPRVRTVPNPSGRTPSALNAAIGVARHPVVVRVDGHGILPPDYVRVAVDLLNETGAANVGGIMAAEGTTDFEDAVARAMTSKLGVGNASFHTGGGAGPADTVYLGVFRREVLDRLGGYNEEFVRAQDWELNYRIRQSGHLIWFSPDLRVSYRPRPSVKALAKQYRDYGRWRRVVTRHHRGSVNPRYLAAPAALLAVAGGTVVGTVGAVAGRGALTAAFVLPAGYAAAILGGAAWEGRGMRPSALARLPIALATMHGSWGWGFLTSPRSLADQVSIRPVADVPPQPDAESAPDAR
ncbi:glycosyltransferase family 2 protein [Yinghuangia seranimata]|uniref:glycosyltransferase family 2 protein n=1 Tax=Yinghuangia seranimata TaxID=408067 RepID=UPI00248B55A1|nr:glycosyltransferase family 2 protein [Yinghuangia seranimata]MDI2132270.1 glycosyltransferase family 2 protein [Yinghuangia seranimata]